MEIRLKSKKLIFEIRATTILYNYLTSLKEKRFFLLPSNVCAVIPFTFMKARVPFELIDISPLDLCLDRRQVLSRLSKFPQKYGGVFFVRTYGLEKDFHLFFKKLKSINRNIIIIDDRCLSIPENNPKHLNYSDLILYSTGYGKFVDIGWGGFAFINNESIYKRNNTIFNEEDLLKVEQFFKDLNKKNDIMSHVDSNWLNTAIPHCSFQEYWSLVKKEIKKSTIQKNGINRLYFKRIPTSVQFNMNFQNWRFNIRVQKKESLIKKLFDSNLFASSHYRSVSEFFSTIKSPIADELHAQVVNLFNDKYYNLEMADRTINIVIDHLKEFKNN